MADNDVLSRCVDRLMARGFPRSDIQTRFISGRVEVLGKHTDYCGGRSVTCAIDRGIHVAFVTSEVPTITAVALDLDDELTFGFSPSLEAVTGWANYPTSVARRLARNFGGPLRGATFVFSSTLPQAAGMSSSSALIITTFLVLDAANEFVRRAKEQHVFETPFELAEYLGTLENGQNYRTLAGDRGVGTFGGSEDHTAITLARAGHLGVYGYSPTRLEREVALPADYVLAIASSGVVAEKTGAARDRYNRASSLVRELVQLWNRHEPEQMSLAAITRSGTGAAARLREMISDHVTAPSDAMLLERRLEHFLAESEQIIPRALDALGAGDLTVFGDQVKRSQHVAETLLQNQVEETIFLAKSAVELGAIASSSFGAGFGGSVWSLVPRSNAREYVDRWQASYAEKFAIARSAFFTVEAINGTSIAPANPRPRAG